MPERPTAENCIESPTRAKSPYAPIRQVDQLGQAWGRHHRGFVDHHGRPGREVIALPGWSVETVFDEQLIEGVGVDAGVDCEHLGCCGRRGYTEAGPAPGL